MTRVLLLLLGWVGLLSSAVPARTGSHAYVVSNGSPESLGWLDTQSGKIQGISFEPVYGTYAFAPPDGSEIWLIAVRPNPGNVGYNYTWYVINVATRDVVMNLAIPDVSEFCGGAFCLSGVFRPDGKYFYLQTSGHLLAYRTATHTLEADIVMPNLGAGTTTSLAVSPDNRTLFFGNNAEIGVFDTRTLQLRTTINFPAFLVAGAGETLLASGNQGLALIDMNTLAIKTTVPTEAIPQQISVSRDGTKASLLEVTGALQNVPTIQVADITNAAIVATNTPDIGVNSVLMSPDGTEVIITNFVPYGAEYAIGPQEQTLDAATLEPIQTTTLIATGTPCYAGSKLFYSFASGLVTAVDLSDGTVSGSVVDGATWALLAVSPAKELVYSMSNSGTEVINTLNGQLGSSLPPANDDGSSALLAASATQLYTSTLTGTFATNLVTGDVAGLPLPSTGVPNCYLFPDGLFVSPNSQILLMTDYETCGPPPDGYSSKKHGPGIALYRTRDQKLMAQVDLAVGGGVVFSPDSRIAYVASGTAISVLKVATATISTTWQFPEVTGWGALAISPDAAALYGVGTTATGTSVFSIDTATGAVTTQIPIPGAIYSPLGVSPDGAKIAIGALSAPYSTDVGILDVASGVLTFADTGYSTGPMVVAY